MLTNIKRRMHWREVRHLLGLDCEDWPDALTIGQISGLQTCPHIDADWSEYGDQCREFAATLFAEWRSKRLAMRGPTFLLPQSSSVSPSVAARYRECERLMVATKTGSTGFATCYLEDAAYIFQKIQPSSYILPWLSVSRNIVTQKRITAKRYRGSADKEAFQSWISVQEIYVDRISDFDDMPQKIVPDEIRVILADRSRDAIRDWYKEIRKDFPLKSGAPPKRRGWK